MKEAMVIGESVEKKIRRSKMLRGKTLRRKNLC
jgi:hypothetical protein